MKLSNMKLKSSLSEQNVYLTYVCLISDIRPSCNTRDSGQNKPSFNFVNNEQEDKEADCEDVPILVERSKALHELIVSKKKSPNDNNGLKQKNETEPAANSRTNRSESTSNLIENEENNFLGFDNPNILKLTKMKWLSENNDEALDSSSPSPSPSSSTCSSGHSQDNLKRSLSTSDKYLSTIIQLDKEHNMFGLSNIAIVGSRPSKKIKKDDDKPAFPQTAIVQVCCGMKCCKHKSNTDLPVSLKCGGCRGFCFDSACPSCFGICPPYCNNPPYPSPCSSCPREKCSCKVPCPPTKCLVDCTTCFGLKIKLNKKPKFEPSPVEVTPRSSSVLQKPLAARSCHHLPHCMPPSSCFPYLMPCYWPARAGAPCSHPDRCFHNPPCPAPRTPKPKIPPEEMCPETGKCEDPSKKTKCPNLLCLGNNPDMKKEIENRFGKS
ncbi:uncharacterized protein LOC101742399 isoform X1 [Bombyx mori]|uniref:Uncharacterized protein n=2 Tax=Bombyx mori TaxID=7091 RepID=A0A8R2DN18_BOMMO|nr:uncharacterized protein LOC101742399 isoform X1 [Bombyx mori]